MGPSYRRAQNYKYHSTWESQFSIYPFEISLLRIRFSSWDFVMVKSTIHEHITNHRFVYTPICANSLSRLLSMPKVNHCCCVCYGIHFDAFWLFFFCLTAVFFYIYFENSKHMIRDKITNLPQKFAKIFIPK